MKIQLSLRTLRLLIPIIKWAIGNIESKKAHSVDETEKLELLKKLVGALEK